MITGSRPAISTGRSMTDTGGAFKRYAAGPIAVPTVGEMWFVLAPFLEKAQCPLKTQAVSHKNNVENQKIWINTKPIKKAEENHWALTRTHSLSPGHEMLMGMGDGDATQTP